MAEELYNLRYAGDRLGYRALLSQWEQAGICIFCPEHLDREPVFQTQNWFAVENQWPYPNAALHLLIIAKRHITEEEQLTGTDFGEIVMLHTQAKRIFPSLQNGGALILRFGKHSGATVRHLHFHLIAPVTDPETGRVYPGNHVNFPVG